MGVLSEKRLAIHHQPGPKGVGTNVFGATVANHELFQALVRHGGLDRVDFITPGRMTAQSVIDHLLGGQKPRAAIGTGVIMNQVRVREAGTLFKGGPRLDELAWIRRRASMDRGYSLAGLIHTLAPQKMRADIVSATVAPMHSWDALICTSPSVKTALEQLFDDYRDYLVDRFGPIDPPRPQMPLIPLGVDGERFAVDADRPEVRAEMRESLGCGPDDILVIWVGRLSYFEKAFPQPMMRAIAEAAAATGRRLHFAMVGWFPSPETEEPMYREAAKAYGPNVDFHVVNGNDRDLVGRMWAAADIFISLVDNIQETFGITPLEAMASGVPVVVSDWDGYRYTVEHGRQGMLIPTLIGEAGSAPPGLALGHMMGSKTYQQYVGIVAQHTAVDVGAAAEALKALIESRDLRLEMGQAGRRRVREMFDWRVVAPQYVALTEDLRARREAAPDPRVRSPLHPAKGDPFRDFAGFATQALGQDTRLAIRPGSGMADLDRAEDVTLDMFASIWRADMADCRKVVELLQDGPMTVQAIVTHFPQTDRRQFQLALLWMCKIGLLAWS